MHLLVALITLGCNLLLGMVVLRNSPKSTTNRLFALLTLVISAWVIANYFSLLGQDQSFTLFWIRAVMLITTPITPLIYLFLKSFPDNRAHYHDYEIALICLGMILVGGLSLTPFVFKDVYLYPAIRPVPGPLVSVWGFFSLGYLAAGLRQILMKYRHSSGQIRLQMKYLIFGFFLTFSLMILSNFIVVLLLGRSDFVVFGPLFSLILLSFVTYAIVKHRLMDIRFVLARTVSYSLLTLIIVSAYTIILYLIGHLFFAGSFAGNQLIISAVLSLVVAYTFQPLRHFLEIKTDKYFFQELYDPEDLLEHISNILAVNIDISKLCQLVLGLLNRTFRLGNSLIYVKASSSDWQSYSPKSTSEKLTHSELLLLLNYHHAITVFDDLPEGKIKTIMRQHSLTAFLVLHTKEKNIGLLLLGHKLSGDVLNPTDLDVLEILGPQLSLAIENSEGYERIKNFGKEKAQEVRVATKSLKTANQKLKELDKLKDDFVSMASHELRTPMTAIKSYLWMTLNGQAGPLRPKQQLYLQRSYDSTDRLIKLVNDMLNISRIESGRISLELSKVDLNQLLLNVVREVEPRFKELGIGLDLISSKTPLYVIADSDKIHEVIMNLIGNSLKFTPKRGKISIGFSKNEGMVVTQIQDSGVGMTPAMIKNLFQKFGLLQGSYQVNKISTSQGTGLGLYICRQILALHQGKIWAESSGLNQGSTFYFSLPAYTPTKLVMYQAKYQHQSDVGIIHNSKI